MNLSTFLSIIFTSFIELGSLVGVLLLVGFVLGILERYSTLYLTRAFGIKGVLFTAWIGTPIHEIGHLIQCFIWGHKVTRVKLLQLNSSNGVLGYVEHQYNKHSLYQQVGLFFIGLGPIFSGIGAIILGMYWLLPETYRSVRSSIFQGSTIEASHLINTLGDTLLLLTKNLFTFENILNPMFWIFLLLAISISSHIALSKADIQGASKGLIALFFMLILFNVIAGLLGFNSQEIIGKIARYNVYVLVFSSIALLFSLLTFVFSYLLYRWKVR
ncbi:hypothetical protein SAMN05192533_101383 [Mesobacillus persicus]|uniref:Uncharacterized protein n=1 Tax=Mesobacillus persicus TaxID=930146 RepID=A0A1H7WFH4_9BACI|nr:hypothetical protein SAMN05192533_101383 [Mesobacillus persicus]